VKLAECNRIHLVWVPGHVRTDGNEIADQLARQGSSLPLIGLKPALGLSAKVAREVIRDWMSKKHESSIDSPLTGRGRLMPFLKDSVLKELGNCSISKTLYLLQNTGQLNY
jgi:hypothetical protein